MLVLATLAFMALFAVLYWRAGAFSAFCMLVNILIAGVVAFNFFEPLANAMERSLRWSPLRNYEDFLALGGIFFFMLIVLYLAVFFLNWHRIEYHEVIDRGGGALFGLVSGYLFSGFLICALQTLPLHENFLGFTSRSERDTLIRSIIPADRAWLDLMRRTSGQGGALARRLLPEPVEDLPYGPYHVFDRHESFDERYRYFRRYGEDRPPLRFSKQNDGHSQE